MVKFKDLSDRTDEFRFAQGDRSCVLIFYELINNCRVVGVDHAGNPFRINIGIWNSLELATEHDFRRLAQEAEAEQLAAELEGQDQLTNESDYDR